ncbi:helicase HerA domain-containing protein [Haloglomus halophilum]|uniref:helicase HerA domain-containing protein n=1 Tax=Haloglomus halophilum TaxID=2962672 RepID=UPI0020C984E6|nr:DUF87 domain-containing protein [Haloglomus halophilum]
MGDEDTEAIRVGETSEGVAADAPAGNNVELPVVELMTGRGFVTGKSGGGKSNTASVVIEKLLDRGLPVMIVDIDGEYYGLKEEYEILHVGADEECDLVVNEEHAGKLSELALEQNVPIILDVSSFLDESDARDLLTAVARNLFAKEKKLKQPFLLVVEEVHEYIPEGGGLDECGRMLIKAAKRGRKHGLGVVGVSQRPADVKKDFITQCDWLVWHRLTWENDTKVVSRILGREYADAIEGMDDGEAFVLTDWSERVRRVQFDRKETFDAGATPGLDDFERPELKSVSSDLVQDLEAISEAEERRESRIQELERKLADRDERIEELEEQLAEAKDLSKMAERFSRAMIEHASGRAFRTDVTVGTQTEMDDWRKQALRGEHVEATRRPANPTDEYLEAEAEALAESTPEQDSAAPGEGSPAPDEPQTETTAPPGWPEEDEEPSSDEGEPSGSAASDTGNASAGSTAAEIDAAFEALTEAGTATDETAADATEREAAADTTDTSSWSSESASTPDAPQRNSTSVPGADGGDDGWPEFSADAAESATTTDESSTVETVVEASDPGFEREVVREVKATIRGFDEVTRRMLAHYREHGATDPVDAHVAAGGDGNRTRAYSRNRTLRQADLVAHAGRGRYGCRLAAHLREAHGDRLSEAELAAAIEAVEAAFVESHEHEGEPSDATGAERAGTERAGDDGREDASTPSADGRQAENETTSTEGARSPASAAENTASAGDVLAPDDDAEFIDAEAVQADEESAGGASTAALDDDPADVPRGTEDVDPDQSVVDASGDGHDQFQPPEERTASDGGESDDFPKWPGE